VFFVATIIGAGVVWNGVDVLFGGLADSGAAVLLGAFALLAAFVLVFWGETMRSEPGHVRDLIVAQLPVFASLLVAVVESNLLHRQAHDDVVRGTLIDCALLIVPALIYYAVSRWAFATGSSNVPRTLQRGAQTYETLTFSGEAWELAAAAAAVSAAIGYVISYRKASAMRRWLTGTEIADLVGERYVMEELWALDVEPKYRPRAGGTVPVPHWPTSVLPLLRQRLSQRRS
jgi:hypothetical protein